MNKSKFAVKAIRELCECNELEQCKPCETVFLANYQLETLRDEYREQLARITREKVIKKNEILQQVMRDLGILSSPNMKVGGDTHGANS